MTTKVIVGDFELILLRPMEQLSVDGPAQQRSDLIYFIGSMVIKDMWVALFLSY